MGRVIWVVLCLGICLYDQARAKRIDLNKSLEPNMADYPRSSTSDFIQGRMNKFERVGSGRKPVGNKTYVLGTNKEVSHDYSYKGFLSVVIAAYKDHLTLVTSPDDWWLTIAQRVVGAVDGNSKKESVKNHFVAHEGKKKLEVHIKDIYGISEAEFFSQMTEQVAKNIQDPDYVSIMQPDFSTTTSLHGIVGNIAIMSSLQEYFEFIGGIECGIPSIEMKGTLADWEKLEEKFSKLKASLAPISEEIGLQNWWSGVEKVLAQLVKTFKGEPDTDWWNQIVEKRERFVGCGTRTEWNGWFLKDFLKLPITKVQSSLVSVPLTIDDNGSKTDSALVAGIAGFNLDQTQNSVEAQHAWNLMLDPTSYLRRN